MMADFARIKDQNVWINLDYVVRIERGDEAEGTATVTFADGSTFAISDADRKRLVSRLRPPKKKKKKKKKKEDTPPAPIATDGERQPTPDEAGAS